MQIILMLHALMRWLIILVALAVIIKFAIGWLRSAKFTGLDRGLASAFSGLMDAQVLLGIIYLIWSGLAGVGFPSFRIIHAVSMLVAAAIAHLSAMWKKADDAVRFRNTLFTVLLSLVVVFIGLSVLPGI